MSKINGNSVLVFVNNVAIGCLTGCKLNSKFDEIITTCKDNNGAKTTIPGGSDWSIDFNGNFETSSALGLSQLIDAHLAKSLISVRFGMNGSGGLYLTGSGYLIDMTWEGPLNAVSVFSGKVSPAGDLTKGTHT